MKKLSKTKTNKQTNKQQRHTEPFLNELFSGVVKATDMIKTDMIKTDMIKTDWKVFVSIYFERSKYKNQTRPFATFS
tara:strand:+ start:313 stop:543 length:231 start_codon:yes stop_codon:yes gene_type:complete